MGVERTVRQWKSIGRDAALVGPIVQRPAPAAHQQAPAEPLPEGTRTHVPSAGARCVFGVGRL